MPYQPRTYRAKPGEAVMQLPGRQPTTLEDLRRKRRRRKPSSRRSAAATTQLAAGAAGPIWQLHGNASARKNAATPAAAVAPAEPMRRGMSMAEEHVVLGALKGATADTLPEVLRQLEARAQGAGTLEALRQFGPFASAAGRAGAIRERRHVEREELGRKQDVRRLDAERGRTSKWITQAISAKSADDVRRAYQDWIDSHGGERESMPAELQLVQARLDEGAERPWALWEDQRTARSFEGKAGTGAWLESRAKGAISAEDEEGLEEIVREAKAKLAAGELDRLPASVANAASQLDRGRLPWTDSETGSRFTWTRRQAVIDKAVQWVRGSFTDKTITGEDPETYGKTQRIERVWTRRPATQHRRYAEYAQLSEADAAARMYEGDKASGFVGLKESYGDFRRYWATFKPRTMEQHEWDEQIDRLWIAALGGPDMGDLQEAWLAQHGAHKVYADEIAQQPYGPISHRPIRHPSASAAEEGSAPGPAPGPTTQAAAAKRRHEPLAAVMPDGAEAWAETQGVRSAAGRRLARVIHSQLVAGNPNETRRALRGELQAMQEWEIPDDEWQTLVALMRRLGVEPS